MNYSCYLLNKLLRFLLNRSGIFLIESFPNTNKNEQRCLLVIHSILLLAVWIDNVCYFCLTSGTNKKIKVYQNEENNT